MKKIIKALLVLSVVCCILPVQACSKSEDSTVTGAACSIKELQNLEKSSNLREQVKAPERERDLRPLSLNREPVKTNKCLFDGCIVKTLFGI